MSPEEFVTKNDGQLFYRHEGKFRVVSVAYVYNEDKTITYGATIHEKSEPCDFWVRKIHANYAIKRCLENGVVVNPNGLRGRDLHHFLRKCLAVNGCFADISLEPSDLKYKETSEIVEK